MTYIKTINGIKYCGKTIEAFETFGFESAIKELNISSCYNSTILRTAIYISKKQGQMDLIQDIKKKVAKLEENTTITDFAFDIVHLLKTIKPVQDENRSK